MLALIFQANTRLCDPSSATSRSRCLPRKSANGLWRRESEFLYDNVKLNYTLVPYAARRHTWHEYQGPCIMHAVFCDVRMRLHPLLPLKFTTCYEFSRRAASTCEIGRVRKGAAPVALWISSSEAPTVANRTANIGDLEGCMKIPHRGTESEMYRTDTLSTRSPTEILSLVLRWIEMSTNVRIPAETWSSIAARSSSCIYRAVKYYYLSN